MGKQQELKWKQVGQNVLVTIDKVNYSKVIKDKEEREKAINEIKLYNKLNSEARKKKLITLFSKKEAEKVKKEALVKGVKKAIKKVTKEVAKKTSAKKIVSIKKDSSNLINDLIAKSNSEGLTESEIQSLQELVKANKKVEEVKEEIAPVVTNPVRRSGER